MIAVIAQASAAVRTSPLDREMKASFWCGCLLKVAISEQLCKLTWPTPVVRLGPDAVTPARLLLFLVLEVGHAVDRTCDRNRHLRRRRGGCDCSVWNSARALSD